MTSGSIVAYRVAGDLNGFVMLLVLLPRTYLIDTGRRFRPWADGCDSELLNLEVCDDSAMLIPVILL